MYRWDGIIWALQKTSADALAGTVDFATVQAINIDANAISTGTLTGANFWLNLITGIMQFTNPSTGDTLNLDQAKIIFGAGTTYERILEYTSEGLRMRPGPNNTGTNLNTSLRLHGGVTYIDFFPGDGDDDYEETDPRARIETNGQYINLKTAYGESVRVVDWTGVARDIIARDFMTADPYNPTYHYADRWEAPRDGNRGMVISPNGTGVLYVSNPEQTAYYGVWASAFVVSSSEKFKENISKFNRSGLDLVNSVEITEYDLLQDDGKAAMKVNSKKRKDIGFIAEKNPEFTAQNGNDKDGTMVDLYRTVSIQMKAIQELSARNDELEKWISKLEKI